MTHAFRAWGWRCVTAGLAVLLAAPAGWAQALPGPADVGRIEKRQEVPPPPSDLSPPKAPARAGPENTAPAESRNVTLLLKGVRITGMHAFAPEDVQNIYQASIGTTITLDTVWKFAGALTERYRDAGYFLSRATVPQQDIKDGIVTIHVIEGYIGDVQFGDPRADNHVVRGWIKRVQAYRPLKTDQIESVLLQLNDLPGLDIRAVLEPLDNPAPGQEGAVRLVLIPRDGPLVHGQVSVDNFGSKFLGPYEATAQAQAVLLPLQRTSVTGLATSQIDELKYGGIHQDIPLIPGGTLELYGSHTKAEPGYTLLPQDILSNSTSLGVAFNYKIIRQRSQNLTSRVALETRDTNSDILGTPLTRDSIRVLRANLTYDTVDRWNGYDVFSTTLSDGLDAFGASKAGQLNLSRAEATPDFLKLELSANRTQAITPAWAVYAGASGQLASGPLYSSEEFGYGGQAFGRAFDDSEITGDHGLAGTAELRYTGMDPWNGFQAVPYAFYDAGMVWNFDADQEARSFGSSAGGGVRLLTDLGFSANVGVALPLARDIANPIYSGNGSHPRYILQAAYGF